MAKGSPKQSNELRKQAKAKIHSLENIEALEFVARLPHDWLPEQVTTIANQDGVESEPARFVICFDHLNNRECKFDGFNAGKASGLVHNLKRITDCEIRSKGALIRDKLERTTTYESLYNGLTPDVDLFEIAFSGDGRIFFFHVAEKLHIVSIEDTHRNT